MWFLWMLLEKEKKKNWGGTKKAEREKDHGCLIWCKWQLGKIPEQVQRTLIANTFN